MNDTTANKPELDSSGREIFDALDQWQERANPIIDQLYALAQELNIPLFLTAGVKNSHEAYTFQTSTFFPSGRTPSAMYMSDIAVRKGVEVALAVGNAIEKKAANPIASILDALKGIPGVTAIPIDPGKLEELAEGLKKIEDECTNPDCKLHGEAVRARQAGGSSTKH